VHLGAQEERGFFVGGKIPGANVASGVAKNPLGLAVVLRGVHLPRPDPIEKAATISATPM